MCHAGVWLSDAAVPNPLAVRAKSLECLVTDSMPHTGFPPCRLFVEKGEQAGMIFPVRDQSVSIGRGPDNAIQIIDTRMSRNHAVLSFADGKWSVRDLGSKNGVQVNGKPISGQQPLAVGDRIQVGDTVLAFEGDTEFRRKGSTTSGMRVLDDDGLVRASQVLKVEDPALMGDTPKGPWPRPVPAHDAERLGLLYKISDMVSSILDQSELLDKIVDLLQRLFAARSRRPVAGG